MKYYDLPFVAVVLATCFPFDAHTQTEGTGYSGPRFHRPSPEVYAALKIDAATRLSNTGATTVSVPLGSIESGSHEVSANLHYSTGGVKAAEVPTYIGLGWSMGIGASLTRVVEGGVADEKDSGYLGDRLQAQQITAWVSESYYECLGDLPDENISAVFNRDYDYAPDRFRYNIGGLTGEFRFDLEGGIQFYPHRNVRVLHADDLSWFELTTPQGIVYRFGGEDANGLRASSYSAVGFPASNADHVDNAYTDEWHLTEVRNAAGRVIFRVQYRPSNYASEQQTYYWRAAGYTDNDGCRAPSYTAPTGADSDSRTGSHYVTVYHYGVVPKRITAEGLGRYLSFSYENDRRDVRSFGEAANSRLRLRSVTAHDGYRSQHRELVHTYAEAEDASAYYEYKLVLEGVRQTANGRTYGAESFVYDFPVGDVRYRTVSRLSPYVDAWGYLNSLQTTAVSFVRRFNSDDHYILNESRAVYDPVEGDTRGMSRRPTLEGSRHGALTRHTDALGATRKFDYELHRAASFAPQRGSPPDASEPVAAVRACRRTSTEDCSDCTGRSNYPRGEEKMQFTWDPDDRFYLDFKIDAHSRSVELGDGYYPSGPSFAACFEEEHRIQATARIQRIDNGAWLGSVTLNDEPDGGIGEQSLVIDLSEIFMGDEGANPPASPTEVELVVTVQGSGYAWAEVRRVADGAVDEIRYADQEVGGLRLSALTLRDEVSGSEAVTTYAYQEPGGKTSGRLMSYPVFGLAATIYIPVLTGKLPAWFLGEKTRSTVGCVQSDEDEEIEICIFPMTHYYTNPESSITNAMGSHISYESISTHFPLGRGSVVRGYRPVQSVAPGQVSSTAQLSLLKAITYPGQGDLLSERYVDDSGVIVKSVVNEYVIRPLYEYDCRSNILITRLNSWPCVMLAEDESRGIIGPTLSAYDGENRTIYHELVKKTIIQDGVQTEKTYMYYNDRYRLPLAELTTGSAGEGNQVTYEYAHSSGDNATRLLAMAGHQLTLPHRTAFAYVTDGKAVSVSATTISYEVFDALGAHSSASSGVMLRPAVYTQHGYKAAGAPATKVTEATVANYNAYGQPREVAFYDDASPTRYDYSGDRLTSSTFLNAMTSATYHGQSRHLETETTANGQFVEYDYDALGRLERVRERGGARATTYRYGAYSESGAGGRNWSEEVVAVTPTGTSEVSRLATRTYYNGLRRPIQTVRAGQRDGGGDLVEDLGYDAFGRLTHRYDVRERPGGGASTAYLAPAGLTAVETIAYAPDPLDRVSAVTRPLYGSTATTYGASAGEYGLAAGAYRKTAVTDAEGLTTTTFADALGRIVHRATNATSVRREYDALGRLGKVYRAWPDQSAAHAIAYGYDAFGRVTARTVPEEGRTDYRYDGRGRLVAEQGPHERARGFARGFAYDAYGDLEATGKLAAMPTDGDAALAFTALIAETDYHRDAGAADFGQPEQTRRYTDAGAELREVHEYDAYGRLFETRTHDDARHHGGSSTYAYYRKRHYDQLDNLVTDYQQNISRDARAGMRYHYDPQGYLAFVERTVGRGEPFAPVKAVDYDRYGRPAVVVLGEAATSGAEKLVEVSTAYDLQGGVTEREAVSRWLQGAVLEPTPPPGAVVTLQGGVGSPGGGGAVAASGADLAAAESTYDLAVELRVLPGADGGGRVRLRATFRAGGAAAPERLALDTAYVREAVDAGRVGAPGADTAFALRRRGYSAYDLPAVLAELLAGADGLTTGDPARDGAVFAVAGAASRRLERAHARDLAVLGVTQAPPRERAAGGAPVSAGDLVAAGGPPATTRRDLPPESTPRRFDVFEQHVYRAEPQRYLGVPARGDGRVSFTRTSLLGEPAFDFAYTYAPEHDHALVSSQFARLTPDGGSYEDLGHYGSSYRYAAGPGGLGNLTELRRSGVQAGRDYAELVDLIYYEYGDAARPGRLTNAGEWWSHTYRGYRPGYRGTALSYDGAGRATQVAGGRIAYDNDAGRASAVTVYGGSTTTNLLLRDGSSVGYEAGGHRYVRYGDIELRDGAPWRIYHADGYYDLAEGRWVWVIRDYLGTPRATVTDADGDGHISSDLDDGEVLQTKTLYPYGLYAFGYDHPGHEPSREDYTGHDVVGAEGGGQARLHAVHDMRARHYSPGLGRMLGVDPSATRYPGESPYNYTLNDPINNVDVDGEDVVPIVFPDYLIQTPMGKVPGLGHAGVLLIDDATGLTKYYEYGRYDKAGHGIVRNKTIPNVVMGPNGRPTEKSMQRVLAAISRLSGHGGRIEGAYIESDNFDEMNSYAQERMAQNSDSSRERYYLYDNNCGTFMCDVAKQDENVASQFPWILDTRPNNVISELRDIWDPVDFDPNPDPVPEPEPEPEPDPDPEPDPRA